MTDNRLAVSTSEAAALLGVTPSTVRRWIKQGVIDFTVKPNSRTTLIPVASLHAFLSPHYKEKESPHRDKGVRLYNEAQQVQQ